MLKKCCHLLEKKVTHPMRMQDFQTQQKPHVTKAQHNANKAFACQFSNQINENDVVNVVHIAVS